MSASDADPFDDRTPGAVEGWIADDLRAEFPVLELRALTLPLLEMRSPPELRDRLKRLSDRFSGSQAIVMRQRPVPHAYRVFYRHVGIDPDADRTPIEASVLQRLIDGGWRSSSLLDDVLTIALVETGVPIWALDAACVDGALGLRSAALGERLGRGESPRALSQGRLVVADQRSPLAVLFGDVAPEHGVTRRTTEVTLFSVQVAGVPAIHVEEALYECVDLLAAP